MIALLEDAQADMVEKLRPRNPCLIEITPDGLKVDELELEKSIKTYYNRALEQFELTYELRRIVMNISSPKSI